MRQQLDRIIHESSWRGRADGPCDGHPQGREPQTQLNTTSQGHGDARQRAQIRGRGGSFMNNAGGVNPAWPGGSRGLTAQPPKSAGGSESLIAETWCDIETQAANLTRVHKVD